MDVPYDSYQNVSDDQPKDLTVKTAKKMKPIPPPLNLGQEEVTTTKTSTPLKEFTIIATSPKSPLMQKHLPFRKRAHSISVNMNKQDSVIAIPPTVDEHMTSCFSSPSSAERIPSLPSLTDVSSSLSKHQYIEDHSLPTTQGSSEAVPQTTKVKDDSMQPVKLKEECQSAAIERDTAFQSNATTFINSGTYRSHSIEPISATDLNKSFSQNSFVLDLSTNHSSALLSPAPSSLGSSREELADAAKHVTKFTPWACPWPPPMWHCFQPGTRLKLGGCWRAIEEMINCPPEWPGDLLVERMTYVRENVIQISFCALSSCGEIIAEVATCHTFLVKDRGWVTVSSDDLIKRYGVKCPALQLGDIVIQPQPVNQTLPSPSPDICDRMKRFSFPMTEEAPSTAFLLSPPTTPTRKTQETTDKPKRPMNAFMLFAKRYRLELIQTNPGKDNRAISVILGEAWRSLPQEEREVFIQGAKEISEEQKLLYPDCWKRKRSHSTS